MKFADHLSKETIRKFNQLRHSPKNKDINKDKEDIPSLKKKPEQLSRRDLEDLMGTRRDTYSRVRGAVRRK